MSTIKDTDYLYISARIRAMETNLLNKEKMERMLDARSLEDAAKVLTECGYGEFSSITPSLLEERLAQRRLDLFQQLRSDLPDPHLIEVFQMKYDYHNIKVLLKAQATGADGNRLLIDAGRFPVAKLKEAVLQQELADYPTLFRQAIEEAKKTMALTGDAQLGDFILDRAYFAELRQCARDSGSAFLQGFVRLMIDSANLRSVVRAIRMEKGGDFLQQVLVEGGSVSIHALITTVLGGNDLTTLYVSSPLESAAMAGAQAIKGGRMTEFEKLCDNALSAYLSNARRVPFGQQPVIGYLYAMETELTAARIIMTGRMAGIAPDTIRERLREII